MAEQPQAENIFIFRYLEIFNLRLISLWLKKFKNKIGEEEGDKGAENQKRTKSDLAFHFPFFVIGKDFAKHQ